MDLTETCGGTWQCWQGCALGRPAAGQMASRTAGPHARPHCGHSTSGRRGRQGFSPSLIF